MSEYKEVEMEIEIDIFNKEIEGVIVVFNVSPDEIEILSLTVPATKVRREIDLNDLLEFDWIVDEIEEMIMDL